MENMGVHEVVTKMKGDVVLIPLSSFQHLLRPAQLVALSQEVVQ